MSLEAIALAILSAGRPTSIAVVYALLGAPEPRRLLTAYVLAGFAWSVIVGVVIVTALHGIDVSGDSTFAGIVDVIGGVAALGFAYGYLRGRSEAEERPGSRRIGASVPARLRNPSVAVAAGAGMATHMPGLFYLLGLNAIAYDDPAVLGGTIRVVTFNVIWWAVPLAALALAIRRPEASRQMLASINDWARRNERALVGTFAVLVGLYFTARGIAALA
jgi:Sap, sulfolipid-1-addressing protein